MHGASSEEQILAGLNYDESRHSSVYIHIPFCRSRCLYCQWMVNVDSSEREIDDYLTSLSMEMNLWKERFGVKNISPHSILIGGGTPTALSPKHTAKMYGYLKDSIDLSKCAQITCETEPGTLLGESGLEKLIIMKDNGVNRISLGVQA